MASSFGHSPQIPSSRPHPSDGRPPVTQNRRRGKPPRGLILRPLLIFRPNYRPQASSLLHLSSSLALYGTSSLRGLVRRPGSVARRLGDPVVWLRQTGPPVLFQSSSSPLRWLRHLRGSSSDFQRTFGPVWRSQTGAGGGKIDLIDKIKIKHYNTA